MLIFQPVITKLCQQVFVDQLNTGFLHHECNFYHQILGLCTAILTDQMAGRHIYAMYLTPSEPTFLFYSIILTNQIVEYMSQAKPRRESNPKLVQCFSLHAAPALSQKSKVLLVLGTLHKNAAGSGKSVR